MVLVFSGVVSVPVTALPEGAREFPAGEAPAAVLVEVVSVG